MGVLWGYLSPSAFGCNTYRLLMPSEACQCNTNVTQM
uniref:Uncharacterized protein n=1 Tax=Siphoviridae sp. ct5tj9 TaxID=2823564 RepID=A0A8S5LH62_9CAUD|nr:MAG TPA: hypothetical protein [Siphoviridae sp. ct5tj9]